MTGKSSHSAAAAFLSIFLFAACDQVVQEPAVQSASTHTLTNYVSYDTGVAGKGNGRRQNSEKYRDSSKLAGFAVEGSVQLSALAMIGADGMTDVAVSSGTAGVASKGGLPAGTVTKVQVKSLDPDGGNGVRWTRNFKKLDFANHGNLLFDDLQPGWPISVQANVSGLGKGNTVLRFNETVKMRPNVIAAIHAPEEGTVDELLDISITLTELNGDLGAYADCMLYADGLTVDHAEAVWVDAGDAVECQLQVAFKEAGDYQLMAKGDNVSPGDFDMGDNASEQVTISIKEDEPAGFWWNASASIYSNEYESYWYGRYDLNTYKNQYFHTSGNNTARPMSFPLDINLEISSGEHKWHEASLLGVQPTNSYSVGDRQYECYYLYGSPYAGQAYFNFCSYQGPNAQGNQYSYSQSAYEISYVSSYMGGGYYSHNSGYGTAPDNDGVGIAFGVTLGPANGTPAIVEGYLPLNGSTSTYQYNYGSGYSPGRGGGFGETCYEEEEGEEEYQCYEEFYYRSTYENYYGWASGTPEL